jgi:hypothetical protein
MLSAIEPTISLHRGAPRALNRERQFEERAAPDVLVGLCLGRHVEAALG